jgi:hypothetical protein
MIMDKQKALKAIDAVLHIVESLERALRDDDQQATNRELWSAPRNLLTLNMMMEWGRTN